MTREEKNKNLIEEIDEEILDDEELEETLDEEDDEYDEEEIEEDKAKKKHKKKKSHHNKKHKKDNDKDKDDKNKDKKKNNKKKAKKKRNPIIYIVIFVVIILLIIALICLFNKDKTEEKEDTSFTGIVKENIKNGKIEKEIKEYLDKVGNSADEVSILLLDIDNDEEKELVIYAPSTSRDDLFYFEVDDTVTLYEFGTIDKVDSLMYIYSMKTSKYYYGIYNEKEVLLLDNKDINKIDVSSFDEDYYQAASTYNNKIILERAYSISINDITTKLESKYNKIDKAYFTNEELLEDNDVDLDKIKEAMINQRKEKEEQEEEKDTEKQEEKQETKTGVSVGSYFLEHGTYSSSDANTYYILQSNNVFSYYQNNALVCSGTFTVSSNYLEITSSTTNALECNTKLKVSSDNSFISDEDSNTYNLK